MTFTTKRRALGRGLDALIPGGSGGDRAQVVPLPAAPARRDFFLAPIEEVHPSPDQPRQSFDEARLEELAQSIRESGIIQPLVVRERGAAEGGGFWLIAGERRWRAAQRAGLHDVPVVVREASPAQAFEMALVENVQRADLDPIEEAEAYRRLSDEFGYTQEQLAERVGKDRSTITNALRLLRLPPAVRALVQAGSLSMGHARALLGIEDTAAIEAAARRVAARALSVRATEELVRAANHASERGAGARGSPAAEKSAPVRDLEQKLSRMLGARVEIREGRGGRGTLAISYANLDDLDRILDRIYSAGSR
jgi:ParB family transcriptional regulator, chromosome partitioning protein